MNYTKNKRHNVQTMNCIGTVIGYDERSGFGVIQDESNGLIIYITRYALNGQEIMRGDQVCFNLNVSGRDYKVDQINFRILK